MGDGMEDRLAGAPSGPVFVVGSMGSGTTLMRLILDSHESMAIAQETTFMRTVLANKFVPFWKFGDVWYERLGWSESELDDELRRFYGGLFERFAARQGKRRWGDKSPHHVWHMKAIAALWPDAAFVGMARHPGATVSSIRNRFNFPWDRAVTHWKRFTMEMLLAGMELGERFLLCRYEDLVREPEPVLRAVLEWLGEPWSPAVLEHHVVQSERALTPAVQGHTRAGDPLDSGRIAKWATSMEPEGWRLLRRETRELARYLGYDLDDAAEVAELGGSRGPGGRLATGTDLAERKRRFPGVDWSERPRASLANRLLTPKALKAELRKARGEGARTAKRPAPLTAAPATARRAAKRLAHRLPPRVRSRLRRAARLRTGEAG